MVSSILTLSLPSLSFLGYWLSLKRRLPEHSEQLPLVIFSGIIGILSVGGMAGALQATLFATYIIGWALLALSLGKIAISHRHGVPFRDELRKMFSYDVPLFFALAIAIV